jgi:hypothetical protein
MVRPLVYLYSATVDPAGDPEDFGWWFRCFPCPAVPAGGLDAGPYPSADAANNNARFHVRLKHPREA